MLCSDCDLCWADTRPCATAWPPAPGAAFPALVQPQSPTFMGRAGIWGQRERASVDGVLALQRVVLAGGIGQVTLLVTSQPCGCSLIPAGLLSGIIKVVMSSECFCQGLHTILTRLCPAICGKWVQAGGIGDVHGKE